ncbi:hypothetical protein P7K49_037206 [Saguinus oedipus]|uniref:Uncharacterized protein n=1 Tax=Saguinus oedipus TaxID=9490 RepID=A0ABQ9TIA5_SAGOE|nr:hypothetical protein P7K49_037206 [Saguinus oedipus]
MAPAAVSLLGLGNWQDAFGSPQDWLTLIACVGTSSSASSRTVVGFPVSVGCVGAWRRKRNGGQKEWRRRRQEGQREEEKGEEEGEEEEGEEKKGEEEKGEEEKGEEEKGEEEKGEGEKREEEKAEGEQKPQHTPDPALEMLSSAPCTKGRGRF